jgi:hypothetical protein
MADNYDRRLKKRPVDSKTDLATGVDEHWHIVFKLPAINFIRICKQLNEDPEKIKQFVSQLGCGYTAEEILGLEFETINDAYFGQGIQITVHGTYDEYQGKCDKCNLHFDTGES